MNKLLDDKFLDDDYRYEEFMETVGQAIPKCLNCNKDTLIYAPSNPEYLVCLSCGHEFTKVEEELRFK